VRCSLFFCEHDEKKGKANDRRINMFVIVEGIHDTGKTSLIERLCSGSDTPYLLFQSKRLFPELANIRNMSISDFATGTNCAIAWFAQCFSTTIDVVFDRLHFSEFAYSRLFRDADFTIAMNRFRIVDDKLSLYNVKLIYLYCSYDVIFDRCKSKNEQYTEEHHQQLTEHFSKLLEATNISHCSIDTGKKDQDAAFKIATDFLRSTDEKKSVG
jgi:thymidylate kinase